MNIKMKWIAKSEQIAAWFTNTQNVREINYVLMNE